MSFDKDKYIASEFETWLDEPLTTAEEAEFVSQTWGAVNLLTGYNFVDLANPGVHSKAFKAKRFDEVGITAVASMRASCYDMNAGRSGADSQIHTVARIEMGQAARLKHDPGVMVRPFDEKPFRIWRNWSVTVDAAETSPLKLVQHFELRTAKKKAKLAEMETDWERAQLKPYVGNARSRLLQRDRLFGEAIIDMVLKDHKLELSHKQD